MTKMTCMRGFSGAGKSTRAREIAEETGAVVVCRDDLRKMLLGVHWTGKQEDEDRVTAAEEAQVSALLCAGTSIIVDATHLHAPFLRKWARLATRLGVEFEVIDVIEDVDDCKRRDHARMVEGGRYVGDSVIERQVKKYPVHKWPAVVSTPFVPDPYVPNLDNPDAIIVDIDGTLAHHVSRSPYDYSRVGEDVVDPIIRSLVCDWRYWKSPSTMHRIIVVSGRDGSCRDETRRWLCRNDVPFDALFMRETKDNRPDYLVKYELFNKYIRDSYNVRFVLDDRNQVVEMWRKIGLKCLQVADGNF